MIICPICKKGNIQLFDSSDTMKTLVCDNCSKIINAKIGSNGKVIELTAAGVGIFASIAAILEFLGIDDIDELFDVF